MVKGPVSLVPAFRRGLTAPKPDCMIGFKIPKDGNGSNISGFHQFPLGTLTSSGSPLDKPGIYINPCSPDDNPISFPWGIYELKKEKISYAPERNADLRILRKNSSDAITVKVDTEVERCYFQAAKGAVVCAAMLNQLSKRDLAPPIFAFTSVGPEWGLFICLQTQKQPPQFVSTPFCSSPKRWNIFQR